MVFGYYADYKCGGIQKLMSLKNKQITPHITRFLSQLGQIGCKKMCILHLSILSSMLPYVDDALDMLK